MGIDILNIKPSVISRDLKGKYICIYGPEKCGKTTFAAQMDKNLILSFEIGTNFLSGVRAQPIENGSSSSRFFASLNSPKRRRCMILSPSIQSVKLIAFVRSISVSRMVFRRSVRYRTELAILRSRASLSHVCVKSRCLVMV